MFGSRWAHRLGGATTALMPVSRDPGEEIIDLTIDERDNKEEVIEVLTLEENGKFVEELFTPDLSDENNSNSN